jgi:hypothetical protein
MTRRTISPDRRQRYDEIERRPRNSVMVRDVHDVLFDEWAPGIAAGMPQGFVLDGIALSGTPSRTMRTPQLVRDSTRTSFTHRSKRTIRMRRGNATVKELVYERSPQTVKDLYQRPNRMLKNGLERQWPKSASRSEAL